MCNTADVAAINTMRDFSKITMFLAANGTLAASILVTFAYQVGREGEREGRKRTESLDFSILYLSHPFSSTTLYFPSLTYSGV